MSHRSTASSAHAVFAHFYPVVRLNSIAPILDTGRSPVCAPIQSTQQRNLVYQTGEQFWRPTPWRGEKSSAPKELRTTQWRLRGMRSVD